MPTTVPLKWKEKVFSKIGNRDGFSVISNTLFHFCKQLLFWLFMSDECLYKMLYTKSFHIFFSVVSFHFMMLFLNGTAWEMITVPDTSHFLVFVGPTKPKTIESRLLHPWIRRCFCRDSNEHGCETKPNLDRYRVNISHVGEMGSISLKSTKASGHAIQYNFYN